MPIKFGTDAWIKELMKEINNSAAYRSAAKNWEGDFYFVVNQGPGVPEDVYMYMDLWHGECRDAFEVADPDFDMDSIESNSVCYTGTHDNDTTVGWFRGDGDDTRTREEIVRTRTAALKRTGGKAETVHLDMIRLALSSHSVMAIAPMQDYLGLGSEARFNMPGTTTNNWRWRMEADALSEEQLDSMRRLLEESSRSTKKRLDCVS